ncbi:MAG: type IV pilus modification protein PilV [Sulfuricellaceae bacterium]|jgi:type IV pilus assembly protein PilV
MEIRAKNRATQRGSILLEGLIAILIFSFGILALVGMQAAAIKSTSEAKYRTDASFLANQLVGQMWADNRATMATNYQTGGAAYNTWKAQVEAALPGATANPPTVAFGANNQVTVTVRWQAPSESVAHRFVLVAQING